MKLANSATLGIAGFYGMANRNVLSEHRWPGISYLVSLEVSMIASVWADYQFFIF